MGTRVMFSLLDAVRLQKMPLPNNGFNGQVTANPGSTNWKVRMEEKNVIYLQLICAIYCYFEVDIHINTKTRINGINNVNTTTTINMLDYFSSREALIRLFLGKY